MAYPVLFNACLSDLRLYICVYTCDNACLPISLCGRSNWLLFLSLFPLYEFPVQPLPSINPLQLSTMEKVPVLHLFSFDVEFDVHQIHFSRKAWKLIQQLTLTEFSYINYEPHHSLSRWQDAFPPTFLCFYSFLYVFFFVFL